MNRRRFFPLFTACLLSGALSCLSACSSLPFHHKEKQPDLSKPKYAGKPSSQGLVVEMKLAPDPVRLGEVRQINVTLLVRNVSKNVVTLKFPTTQIIEILLRDPNSGQVLSQWSSERTFTSDPRLLIINPLERVEYNEPITTRELKAGKAYTLEAYFMGYDKELRVSKALLPQP